MSRTISRRSHLIALVTVLSASAQAQTVDDVVRRYLEARGGSSRMHAVQSLRLQGTLEIPGVPPAPFLLELKRPAKMRTEIGVAGGKSVRAFDGRIAWSQAPLPGAGPQPMPPDEAAEARAQADVDLSPLVDPAAKGYTVELVGRDRLPGGDTWKLVVRGGDQPPRTLFLDARTHLVVLTRESRPLEDKQVEFDTEVGDYRSEGGLVFPHRIEVGPRGSAERQRLLIRSVEINPQLDDSRFTMPTRGAAAPAGRRMPDAKHRTPSVLP